jgi:hypothetical protein
MEPMPELTYTVTLTNDELNLIWRAKLMLDDAIGFKSHWGKYTSGTTSRALFDLVGRIKDAPRLSNNCHCPRCDLDGIEAWLEANDEEDKAEQAEERHNDTV